MTRKLIATVLAAAMAITSVNIGTAQAGDRDVAKIIVGATALAIIGSALAAIATNRSTTGTAIATTTAAMTDERATATSIPATTAVLSSPANA